MPLARDFYAKSPEPLIVRLAGRGDRQAFEELVRRRQSWIRNLMRHLYGDITVADDLAQQVFLQAWRKIRPLNQPDRFPGWLKRTAINIWLQHIRRDDPLSDSATIDGVMAGANKLRRQRLMILLAASLAVVPAMWLMSAPVNDAVQSLTEFVLQPISMRGLGMSILAPLNSIASVLGLGLLGPLAIYGWLFS